jgi:hypothetical protein
VIEVVERGEDLGRGHRLDDVEDAAREVARCRRALGDLERPVVLEVDEVGERPARVDADGAHDPSLGLVLMGLLARRRPAA